MERREVKIVYIAGPYRHADPLGVESHISCARSVAVLLTRAGIPYYCPHLNSARFEHFAPNTPDSFYLDMGLAFLARCEAMLVLPDYEMSEGTLAEIAWWREHRGEAGIFYQGQDLALPLELIAWHEEL